MSTPSTGPALPFASAPSASVAGRTLADSKHQWRRERPRLPENPPHIVVLMSDDAGFSAPECFGGPVRMPTMERLAERGLRFNRFHTTAICSPTRAALLTGRNHHAVGFGQISEFASDFDGYVGEIPRSAATIAQVLSAYGYDTGAFGKWHNTPTTEVTTKGPFDRWPTGLGFRYFYGFMAGETSQWEPRLFENTNPIEPPATPEEGYHLTEDLADKTIRFIRTNRAVTPDRPMFIYLAPGATHGPHQVAKEWSQKYRGRFDEGWEALREETFRRQKELGWIPEDAELTPIDPTMQRWDDVPQAQREFQTRLMEVYAGFLEHTDVQYGRVVDELEAQGLLDNTLVFYIHSDNGASAEGMFGTIAELLAQNAVDYSVEQQIEVLERDYGGLDALGTPIVDNMYHHGWAWATDTPLRSTKLVAAHFGGTRTPMVVSWPERVEPDPTPRTQFHHVIDVAATIYDVLGIEPPSEFNGVAQDPLDGDSMVPAFAADDREGGRTTQYFEVMGSRGVYHEGWFAGAFGPRRPWEADTSGLIGWEPDDDQWELYHLDDDYSQARNLAEKYPQKLRELQDMFMIQAARNNVLPIGGGLYMAFHPEEGRSSTLTEWTLYPGQVRIPEAMAPKYTSGFSTLATIDVELAEGDQGVLYALGGIAGGFTAYIDDGHLKAEYNMLGVERYKAISADPLTPGTHQLQVEVRFDERHPQAPATLTLRVDGADVGSARIERSVQAVFTASETFDVGTDLGSPVALDYHERTPFEFTGTIERLHIAYL